MDGKGDDHGHESVQGVDWKGRGAMDPCGEADDDPGALAWTALQGMGRSGTLHMDVD
jgi:hypothetical protein